MTTTIQDAFKLPTPDEIRAIGFVVRIEGEGVGAGGGGVVDSYVITPHVREELPKVFASLKGCCDRGQEVGWLVHGSFGSGKSHFMSFLGKLLEGDTAAWAKDHDVIRGLARDHRDWIAASNLLVVRIHMLSANRKDEGFDRVIYKAFNRALEARGKPVFEFVDVEAVLDQARREAERYGDQFWQQMRKAKVAKERDHFESRAGGTLEEREELAKKYLAYTGAGAAASYGTSWATGLERLADHAKAQGFGGVVFLIDELLLWLGEKKREEFVTAINQLNTFVDYASEGSGRRAVPLAVFVSRQRKISDFFPDMVGEDHVNEYLDHHEERFEKLTLEDVELRWVCKERVLEPRLPDEVRRVVDEVVERHRKIIPELIRDAAEGEAYLRDVYPFHPALIEMLIDVSNLMQRDRTALRLLYELLVEHYPDLPLGSIMPVGSAFEAVFPESGVAGKKRAGDLEAIHRIYWHRFKPAMAQMARSTDEGGMELDETRRRVLDQLVKTALLAEVSPRLKGTTGLTVDRLVKLNDADVTGETARGKILKAYNDLVDLSRLVPDLQVTGSGGAAAVTVVLRGADFGQMLAEARAKVDSPHLRFKTFYSVLKRELRLDGRRGFGEGEQEGEYTVTWRGTKRKGSVFITNVREMTYKQFKVREGTGEEFRLVIDYPWDDPGHTVEEDKRKAGDVRRRDGQATTLCWLPRHMTGEELKVITDLAAARYLLDDAGQEQLLSRLGTSDRNQVLDQARAHAESMETRLRELLRTVYKDKGQTTALMSDVAPSIPEVDLHRNLDHFARALLDRRYPTHPGFSMEPRPVALAALCDWMVEASETPDLMGGFEEPQREVLEKLGRPLEVVDPPGQSRAQLRLDTRYIKAVLAKAETGDFPWQTLDAELEEAHGLQPAVRNLFLVYLLRARSFRARDAEGQVVESVAFDGKAKMGLRLERAEVVNAATWSGARELAVDLFQLQGVGAHRSLQAQDRLVATLRDAGRGRRSTLQRVHHELSQLLDAEDDDRRRELREALKRLKALVEAGLESHVVLERFVGAWPDDPDETLRGVTRDADEMLKALETIDRHSRDLLLQGRRHPSHGEEVRALLSRLDDQLSASYDQDPLRPKSIEDWNGLARELVKKLIRRPTEPPTPPPTPPPPADGETFEFRGLRPADGAAFNDFIRDVREKLRAVEPEVIDVDVVVRPAKERDES